MKQNAHCKNGWPLPEKLHSKLQRRLPMPRQKCGRRHFKQDPGYLCVLPEFENVCCAANIQQLPEVQSSNVGSAVALPAAREPSIMMLLR